MQFVVVAVVDGVDAATALAVAGRIAGELGGRVVWPSSSPVAGADAASVGELLGAWRDSLAASGSTTKHVELFTGRARRVVALAIGAGLREIEPTRDATRPAVALAGASLSRWVDRARMSDLTVGRVQGALAALKAAGRSHQTCNHHRAAIRAFSKWCHETRRAGRCLARGQGLQREVGSAS